jgi:hypothetical protein
MIFLRQNLTKFTSEIYPELSTLKQIAPGYHTAHSSIYKLNVKFICAFGWPKYTVIDTVTPQYHVGTLFHLTIISN